MHHTITVKGIFRESWTVIKPKFWRVIGQFFVVLVAFSALDIAIKNNILLGILWSVLFTFVTTAMSLAYAEKGNFSFKETFHGMTWRRFGYFVAAYLLAKIIIIGGTILLIIPGIIAALQLFVMRFVALQEDLKPIAALKKSVRLTRGYRFKILECVFFAVLLNILGALVAFVGLFFTIPFTFIAFALIYKKLAADPAQEEKAETAKGEATGPVIEAEIVPAA